MTPIATAEKPSSHVAAARAGNAPSTTQGSCTLRDAIQAVIEHRREVEMRRMALAAQHSARSDDWLVPVPRSRLQALEQQARQAALLLDLLNRGSLQAPGLVPQAPERHRPSKPNQRPRLDARPSSAA